MDDVTRRIAKIFEVPEKFLQGLSQPVSSRDVYLAEARSVAAMQRAVVRRAIGGGG